ncbi:MAG: AAA family ATPase [Kiritimatiellia bacterium]|jgi:hypothetical protein|nr:AAA family ATPase [Kiritimatiellia bacterium]
MKKRPRIYDGIAEEHLRDNRQMLFMSGPRQVGKTTVARQLADHYFDWDNRNHQALILAGPSAVAERCRLDVPMETLPVLAFDELHKFARWKNFLKGFFDTYEDSCRILVTGSARLDVYRRGGDSLMGRYFPYHIHPFSVAELCGKVTPGDLISAPTPLPGPRWSALQQHGGFPEPLLKREQRFSTRWQTLRKERLFKEDLRDLTRIQELSLLEIMARILGSRSGEQLIFANLADQVQISPKTAKEWVNTLVSTYYGFLVRPWYKNLNKALRKEPKWFLRDWSDISDAGQRTETLIACHLLKAVECWTDLGLGRFELRYIRDKQKREVDFVVVRDDQAWFLVEAKQSDTSISPALRHYQGETGAEHAFQVILDLPYTDINCFDYARPVAVPALTFLSQLV